MSSLIEHTLRAKDLSGEWIYGTGVTDFLNVLPFLSRFPVNRTKVSLWLWSEYSWKEIRPETLSRFTGIKDSRNNSIFEGDIIDGWEVSYCGDQEGGLGMNVGWYLQRDNFESWTELESRSNENGDNHTIEGNRWDKTLTENKGNER